MLVGCGRIAFDARTGDGGSGDASAADAGVDVIDPVGMLDPGFGAGGIVQPSSGAESIGRAVLAQSGRLVVAGIDFTMPSARLAVIAVDDAGVLDPQFATNGELFALPSTGTSGFGYGLTSLPGGEMLVVGDGFVSTDDDFLVAKIDAAGALVTAFGGVDGFISVDMFANDTAQRAVVVNNTAYACGNADYSADMRFAIAAVRLDTGAPDLTFGGTGQYKLNDTAGSDECLDLVFDGTDLIATGRYDDDVALYHVSLAGTVTPFTTGRLGSPRSISRLASGSYLAVGATGGTGFLMRFDANLALDQTFGTQGVVMVPNDSYNDHVVDALGRIIAVGRRNGFIPVVTRFLPDGTLDTSFAASGRFELTAVPAGDLGAVVIDEVGRIVAVGHSDDGTNRMMILRFQ